MENITAAGNTALLNGNGIYATHQSEIDIRNSIFWDETGNNFYIESGEISIENTDLRGGKMDIFTTENTIVNWLQGNIDNNPHFTGSGENPYSISESSPCLDACFNHDTFVHKQIPFDILGNCRCEDGDGDGIKITDMGAYEFQPMPDKGFMGFTALNSSEDLRLMVYPNPVRSKGVINYQLVNRNYVQAAIYEASGKVVRVLQDDYQDRGEHNISFNTDGLLPGIYLLKLVAGSQVQTLKILVIR